MSKLASFQDVPVFTLDELIQSGDIELGRGDIISKIDIRENTGSYPIYSSSSKNDGMMGRYGKFMFDEEMVTWSVDGGGKFFYRPRHKFSVTNVSGYMRANQEKFDYKFLHGALDFQHSFLNFDYQSKAHPSVIRELYEIPIPPLPEQKKIAAILTSVDEVIEATQKQIDKLQDLKKATMNELLTKGIGHTEFKDSELGRIPKSWEVKTLGELGNVVTGSTPSTTNRDLYDGNYMFVSPSDISEGMFVSETGKKLSLEGINKTRKIPANSIMVVCIGSTIGKVAISTQECASNQQINTIVPKVNDPYFVYFLIKWMAHLIKKEAGTQAVPLINKTEFSNMFGPLPPRDEQKKIGIALHSINVGIQKLSSKLTQTQSLKKSLMQDLLTGKVRVKVD